MKSYLKFGISTLIFIVPLSTFAQNAIVEKAVIDKIIKDDPICSTCRFVTQLENSDWVRNHILYKVTTLDILPTPIWHVAVTSEKEMYILDRRQIDDWNHVMASENVNLSTDSKVIAYARFFIFMTMSQSIYIDKLLPGEIKRIEGKENKKVESKPKIERTSDIIQIIFYTKDTQGELEQWNMIVDSKGKIVKIQERNQ